MHKVGFPWSSVWTWYALPDSPPRTEAGGLFLCKQFPPVPYSHQQEGASLPGWHCHQLRGCVVGLRANVTTSGGHRYPLLLLYLLRAWTNPKIARPLPLAAVQTHTCAHSHPISHSRRYFSGRLLVPFWELMHLVAVERNSFSPQTSLST